MAARTRYDAVAMTLHWVIALGILTQIAMGWGMTTFTLPLLLKFKIYQLHKSIGITVLLAVALRIVWRFTHVPPPLPEDMPLLERRVAAGTHYLLYLLMAAIPLTGWLVASVSPLQIPIVLYGRLPWPFLPVPPGWVSHAADHMAGNVHAWLAYGALGLVVLHVLAALRHHFVLHDDVLRRMWPF